jgi:ParB family chromosome partitioning protein
LHREKILPSEKAFAYKLKFEALEHQGKRTLLTSDQVGPKLTVDMISDTDSATQVKRYIRLTNLIPELLDMMDENKIAFSVGVELSFLDDERQYDVLNACEENDNTPSYAQAVRMHKAYTAGELTRDDIDAIMCEEKANQRETVKIPADRIRAVLPKGYTVKQQEDYIVKALEYYHRYLQKQRENAR